MSTFKRKRRAPKPEAPPPLKNTLPPLASDAAAKPTVAPPPELNALRHPTDHPPREGFLARFARLAADWTGSTAAFVLAALLIVTWASSYPLFAGFGDKQFDTWQLVINTLTTIVTFLMVFLIQRAQNKDSQAIHLKLNELVAAVKGASNRLINAENLTEEELRLLHKHYCTLVELSRQDYKLTDSHSVEEAAERHREKSSEA